MNERRERRFDYLQEATGENTDIDVITLTDDSDMRDILLETGADTVLSPHGVLGHRLAEKAVSSFNSDLTDTIGLGGEIGHGNPGPAGEPTDRHADSQLEYQRRDGGKYHRRVNRRRTTTPDRSGCDYPFEHSVTRLGSTQRSGSVQWLHPTAHALRGHERIIAGQGEVGQAALDIVSEAGLDVVTLDVEDGNTVDIVGDAETEELLEEAGIEAAGAIIVGLLNDSDSLLTTVIARSLNSDIEMLARVSDTDATRKALSAGADYVLSVPRVSARMVARELRGEGVLAPASQIRLLRVSAKPLAGSTFAESGIYEKTGCRVIAVEDDEDFASTVDPQRRFTGEERIVLVGSDEAVQQFRKEFDVSPMETDA